MVDDGDVSRNELCKLWIRTWTTSVNRASLTVLEDRAVGQVYPGALVRDNDDCPSESDLSSEPHVASDGKMVELKDIGDSAEALLEVCNLRTQG